MNDNLKYLNRYLDMLKFLSICLMATAIAGCADTGTQPSPQGRGKTVAVMPLDNQTNSVDGAIYMRNEMLVLLKHSGYQPLSLEATDQILANQFGISLGGQIEESDIPKIASALGVENIMTGKLKSFGAVLLSYNEVSASFTLYGAGEGKPVWTYDNDIRSPFSPLNDEYVDAKTKIISGLIGGILERSFGKPLQDAVAKYFQQLRRTLPGGWDARH